MATKKPQLDRFIKATREADTDMTKEEFSRVIDELATPQTTTKEAAEDQSPDE